MRIAGRIAVFALIGGAATVFTAWGFSQRAVAIQIKPQPARWVGDLPALHLDPASTEVRRLAKPGKLVQFAFDGSMSGYTSNPRSIASMRAGIPCLAMEAVSVGTSNGERNSFLWTWRKRAEYHEHGCIPLRPLWPGFLVDTAFWGGAAFIVWSVPGFVRRRARRRRGRCVRCGYELAGMAVCPECGQ